MKRIWTKDVIDYNGRFYNVPPSKIDLKPIQKPHPPIVLGGFTPRAFTRVAKYADGWMPIAGFGPLDQFGQAISGLKEEAKKHGRDPSTIKVFTLTYLNLSESQKPNDKRLPLSGTIDQIGRDVRRLRKWAQIT